MILFLSNYFNHHQKPFSDAMYELTNGNYRFIATSKISQWRLDLGYQRLTAEYVIDISENGPSSQLLKMIKDADVVIIGSAPNNLIKERLELNRLTFRYNERLLKDGIFRVLDPRMQWSVRSQWTKYKDGNLYTLCASAYTAHDLSLFGYPKSKCFKWGYFPAAKQYQNIQELFELKHQHEDVSILWVGRLIELKHPEVPILIARELKKRGYAFNLSIIGTGKLEPFIRQKIRDYELEDYVTMRGSMTPDEVRKYMESSDIFIFSSDRHEGWGAVLNESMNSACAVVASNAIGSVPFLIKHGENGYIYKGKNWKDAYFLVKQLIDNREEIMRIGKNAYHTIKDEWSPTIAAQNFLNLSSSIMKNENAKVVNQGPCSLA